MPSDSTALMAALAALTAQEPRPEAVATADAIRGGRLLHPAVPCAADAEILALAAHPQAIPEARLIPPAQRLLPWGLSPLAGQQTAGLGAIKAVATLLGPEAPIRSDSLLFGLFYQRPESYYALHAHAADETYTILAGRALWTAGDDTRWRGAGEAIHHPSHMAHAFRTGPEGLLAMWRWSGDLSYDSYRLLPDPDGETG